jgi:signal transduction histidine kinase/CheY-like chemotaxis protein
MAPESIVAGAHRCLARGLARAGCLLVLGAAAAIAGPPPAPAPPVPPQPAIGLQRDGRELALDASSGWLRLAPGDRDFTVRIKQDAQSQLRARRYRVWLEGQDTGWVTLDASGKRRYARLAPGTYRLRTSVAFATGAWSELPEVTLLVPSPWWRSQAALAATSLLALAAAGAWAWAYRSRRRRERAWQLAQQRQQLAEQHSQAKTRFLATLGHEIRTPMTGVLGMAELLQASALDPRQRAQVEAITLAGRHLLRLVNDALDLARIEAGKLVLEDTAFEVRPLLGEVAELLQPLAAAKGLGFSLACDPAVAPALRGDGTRVRQILFNLGHNAIKFCERGRVCIQVSPGRPLGLTIAVSDTGPGLGEEQQRRLFRRFEQGGVGEPGREGGSGLGLAICSELAAAMGGSITVLSQPGQGAVFRVQLPLPEAALPPEEPSAAPRPPGPPCRLLLVEDDAVVAEVVAGLLARAGHDVVHAAHGLAALEELETSAFDAAILDLDLPGMDGLSLARLIRARGRRLPMLALTARVDPEAEPGAYAAGMDGFLRKPVSGERLTEAVAQLPRQGV